MKSLNIMSKIIYHLVSCLIIISIIYEYSFIKCFVLNVILFSNSDNYVKFIMESYAVVIRVDLTM